MVIILELSRPIVWLVRHVCSDKAEFFFLQKKTAFWPFLDRYLDHTLISLNGMGRGVVRILQSLEEVIRSIYHRRTKVLLPHPLPQVMNNDQPPLSYLFICFCYSFILFIYLFIFLITFFSLRESTRRNYFTSHIWGQFQSTFALHSFGWGSVSCSIVKWERSLREG